MAGVGQCQRIGGWHQADTYGYRGTGYGYGYDEPGWGAPAYAPDAY
jgi:hypothetical protein